jgi:hypothetical protein
MEKAAERSHNPLLKRIFLQFKISHWKFQTLVSYIYMLTYCLTRECTILIPVVCLGQPQYLRLYATFTFRSRYLENRYIVTMYISQIERVILVLRDDCLLGYRAA